MMPMDRWNGEERRKATRDHDTLIEMVQILKNLVTNFEEHTKDDIIAQTRLADEVKSVREFQFKVLGGIMVCGFIVTNILVWLHR